MRISPELAKKHRQITFDDYKFLAVQKKEGKTDDEAFAALLVHLGKAD